MPDASDLEALTDEIAAKLTAAGVVYGHGTDNARDEALRLITGVLRGGTLTGEAHAELEHLLDRRIRERLPVPYLTGEAWLHGLRFEVPAGVMIPRSPIAGVLADGIAPWLADEPQRVLDLCCGTGALGILAAHVFEGASVDLVDDDPDALVAARRNVQIGDVSERVEVHASDLFEALVGRRYDLILCNPPYVPTAELDAAPLEFGHEPRHGLDGGGDGLAVWRRVVAGVDQHLAPGGVLIGETGNVSTAFDAAFPELQAVWLAVADSAVQAGGDFGVFVVSAALRERLAGKRL